jgi:hypothetical protein
MILSLIQESHPAALLEVARTILLHHQGVIVHLAAHRDHPLALLATLVVV